MKKRLQGLIAGVLIGVITLGGGVYASVGSRTATILYDNIKMLLSNLQVVQQKSLMNGWTPPIIMQILM